MRTNELHAHATQVQRSSGRSSVAAAAYRSGSQLTDERTGETHDYTRKQGIEFTRIYTPQNSPAWAKDRAKLWNACEAKENRSNSCTAHELEVAFPHEFNPMQRREAGDAIAREILERYGVAVDIAYHKPTARADERNFHAHIMFTTRGFDEATKDGWSKTKFRDLSKDPARDDRGDKIRDDDGKVVTRGQLEIASLREFSANQMNHIAERDNLNVITEHLSFDARDIDREASQHLGPVANDMEKKGKNSRVGDENRERQQRNAERAALAQESAQTSRALAAEKARQQEEINIHQAAVESQRIHENIDMDQRYDSQRSRLEAELEQRNGERRRALEAEQQRLEQQLASDGWRKLMRDLLGKTKRDQEELRANQLNLESLRNYEAREHSVLRAKQEAEREAYNQRLEQRQNDHAQTLEQQRQEALQRVVEADKAPPPPEPANDRLQPPYERTAAPEQDNQAKSVQDFQKAASAAPAPSVTDEFKQKAIEDHKARIRQHLAKGPERGSDGHGYD